MPLGKIFRIAKKKVKAKVAKKRFNKRLNSPGPTLTPLRYAKLEAILKAHGVKRPSRKQIEHVNKFARKELEKILKD